eukprot:1913772-Pleurochrysis_carterae.AAC.1
MSATLNIDRMFVIAVAGTPKIATRCHFMLQSDALAVAAETGRRRGRTHPAPYNLTIPLWQLRVSRTSTSSCMNSCVLPRIMTSNSLSFETPASVAA